MMKIGLFRNMDGASDYYRAVLPLLTSEKKKELSKNDLWISNFLYEAKNNTETFRKTLSSDIYLLQRMAGNRLVERLRDFSKGMGINSKIIIDHEDDVFNVSPMSNHYSEYGTKEIKIVNNGVVIHEWKHGVNIDIDKNLRTLAEVKRTTEQADMITVTTDRLGGIFKIYNPNVKTLPNCVDLKEWNRLPIKRENQDEIRIAWAGGHSHWEDLYMIREPLRDIAKKYPNVKILMIGYMPKSMEHDYHPGQIEFHPWVETPAHPYRMSALDIDIGIIPLVENEFNYSKSPIKWVEFSALKIPSVTSYVSPYDVIQDSYDVDKGIFIDKNNPQGWFEGLETLVKDSELRKHFGAKAREFVETNYDINTQYHQWVNLYKEVLSGNPVESNIA